MPDQTPSTKDTPLDTSTTPRYRAFVSYRHADVDSKVAAAVQRGLERFYVPKSARGSWGTAHIAPVFRDKEELPVSVKLSDDIDAALRGADALVLICSPRTQESLWVAREVDLFLKYHGRSRVFIVLAEGEPADVIPEKLLYETRQVVDQDGTVHEERVEMEPLACDFRESARRERRTEMTRLAAAILSVSFDSLNRRAQRRRVRIGVSIAAVVTAVALGIASYALWSNARIQENYQEALRQQSQYLTTAARQSLEGGDRLKAIELASAALPRQGEDRPLHPEAVQTLSKALLSYTSGESSRTWGVAGLAAKYQLAGTVRDFAVSDDGRRLAAASSQGEVCVWDLQTDELIFSTTFAADFDQACSLVITDDGLLAVASNSVITCYDTLAGNVLWSLDLVRQVEGSDSWEAAHTSDYGLQAASQDQLIALGNECAHLIDLRTGTVDKSVPYEEGDNEEFETYSSSVPGGWDPSSGRLAVYCNRFSWGGDWDVAADEKHEFRVLDFGKGSSTVIELDAEPESVLFLNDGTLLVSIYEANELNMYFNGSGFLQISQAPYTCKTVRMSPDGHTASWTAESSAYQPSSYDEFFDLGDTVEGFASRHIVTHCFANVCELMDLDSGEVLHRWETTNPIVLAWPDDESGIVLDGVLIDGSCFGLRIYDDKPQSLNSPSFYVNMQFVASDVRHLSGGVLISENNTIYRYANVLEGDSADEIYRFSAGNQEAYSTACGILLKQSAVDEKGYLIGTSYSLLNATDGGEVWSKTFTEEEDYSIPEILGDPTNSYQLFLMFTSMDPEMPDRLIVVNLATGDETSFNTDNRLSEPPSSDISPLDRFCLVSSHYAASIVSIETTTDLTSEGGGNAQHAVSVDYLARTDLLTGESTAFPIADLGEYAAGFVDHSLEMDDCSLSPAGQKLIFPLESTYDGNYTKKASAQYGLVDLDTHRLTQLPFELCTNLFGLGQYYETCAIWADDGRHFVMATENELVVFNAQGEQVATLPLEGRRVISVTMQDNQLLMAYQEEADVMLLSYDLLSLNVSGSCTLPDVNLDFVYPEYFVWIKCSSSERDPGDICLLWLTTLYIVNYEPFGVCQVVDECAGYDDVAHAFVVQQRSSIDENDNYGDAYLSYPRHTIDDLIIRGQEVLGASVMSDVERESYGF